MSKGTPKRSIRIDDELWNDAKETAEANGDDLSDVLRGKLREYVRSPQPDPEFELEVATENYRAWLEQQC